MMNDFTTPPHFQPLHEDGSTAADASSVGSEAKSGRRQNQDPLFFLGTRGSGVGFYRHGEAWNAVIFGKKRWFLYPPEWRSPLLALDPEKSLDGLGWYRQQYPLLKDTKLAPVVSFVCL